jgi:hypothetical protein
MLAGGWMVVLALLAAPAQAATESVNGDRFPDLGIWYSARSIGCDDSPSCDPWRVVFYAGGTGALTEDRSIDTIGDTWLDLFAVAFGDFDADGHTDVAATAREGLDGDPTFDPGLYIWYGTAKGVTFGPHHALFPYDWVGTIASGQFGRGRADDLLLGGVPSVGGAVHVLYGGSDGITRDGSRTLTQSSPGMTGVEEPEDEFGSALATGDFDGDGRDDAAIGVPGEAIGDVHAGAVNVVFGSPAGLSAARSQFWHQNRPGVGGTIGDWDAFGTSLATGDVNGDGRDDLAIAAPDDDEAAVDAGAVNVLYGSPAGPTARGSQLWTQASAGVIGVAEPNEHLGTALTFGDYDGDGRDDLAIGVPGEGIGDNPSAGAVNVLYSAGKLSASASQFWHENRPGVPDRIEYLPEEGGEMFGSALASKDLDRDGRDDLAVGIPAEYDEGDLPQGAVIVFTGTGAGLDGAATQFIGPVVGWYHPRWGDRFS